MKYYFKYFMNIFKYEKVPGSVLKRRWSLRATTKKACFNCRSLSLTLSGLLSFLSCYLLSQSEGIPHQTAKLCPGAVLGCRELLSPCQARATAVGEKRNKGLNQTKERGENAGSKKFCSKILLFWYGGHGEYTRTIHPFNII